MTSRIKAIYNTKCSKNNRTLEEIINDPSVTEWAEIRNALKVEGGNRCTNFGLVKAICLGGVAFEKENDAAEAKQAAQPSLSISNQAVLNEDPNSKRNFAERAAAAFLKERNPGMEYVGAEGFNKNAVSLQQLAQLKDPLDSGDCLFERRRPKRRSSYTASSCHSSITLSEDGILSIAASIDVLDFGIDHFVDHSQPLAKIHEASNDTLLINNLKRKNSLASESTYATNGFLGWTHEEESDDSDAGSLLVDFSERETVVEEVVEDLNSGGDTDSLGVDSKGFLDWPEDPCVDEEKNLEMPDIQEAEDLVFSPIDKEMVVDESYSLRSILDDHDGFDCIPASVRKAPEQDDQTNTQSIFNISLPNIHSRRKKIPADGCKQESRFNMSLPNIHEKKNEEEMRRRSHNDTRMFKPWNKVDEEKDANNTRSKSAMTIVGSIRRLSSLEDPTKVPRLFRNMVKPFSSKEELKSTPPGEEVKTCDIKKALLNVRNRAASEEIISSTRKQDTVAESSKRPSSHGRRFSSSLPSMWDSSDIPENTVFRLRHDDD